MYECILRSFYILHVDFTGVWGTIQASVVSFKNSVETYLLSTYDLEKEEDADVKVVKILMGMNLITNENMGKKWGQWYLVFNKILEED